MTQLAQPVLDAGPGQPPIIARSAWAQGRARPAGPANYGTIKLAFVHHTDNPNGYSRGDVPALLLAIFDYHRYVRGFFDIAYNFIIDAFGRDLGGARRRHRRARDRRPRRAASTPSRPGSRCWARSCPWSRRRRRSARSSGCWRGSSPCTGSRSLGKVTVVVDPADAFYTPFRPGAHVLLPRVAGHRDGDLTDCPGNAFYDRLPAIRPRIAQLAGSARRC